MGILLDVGHKAVQKVVESGKALDLDVLLRGMLAAVAVRAVAAQSSPDISHLSQTARVGSGGGVSAPRNPIYDLRAR